MRRRQRLLRIHRADVLYDAPNSRVGSNFLAEVSAKCVPYLLHGKQPPARARSWTAKCMKAAAASASSSDDDDDDER